MALSQRSRAVLTLFTARNCVHCHRIRLVLSAKGVSYDQVIVDLDDPPEDLQSLRWHHFTKSKTGRYGFFPFVPS